MKTLNHNLIVAINDEDYQYLQTKKKEGYTMSVLVRKGIQILKTQL